MNTNQRISVISGKSFLLRGFWILFTN